MSEPNKLPSVVDQLLALDINETLTRSVQVAPENLSAVKANLRQNAAAPISRAKQRSGYTYSCECSETITSSGRVYAIMIISRTS